MLVTKVNTLADKAARHFILGRLLADQGDDHGAIAEYRKELALKPDPSDGHYFSAQALLHSGRKQDAARELQEAKHLWPSFEAAATLKPAFIAILC